MAIHTRGSDVRDGQAALYADGKRVATAAIGGDVANWDGSLRLALRPR